MKQGKLISFSGMHGTGALIKSGIDFLDEHFRNKNEEVVVTRNNNTGRIYACGASKNLDAWHYNVSQRADAMLECAGNAQRFDHVILPAILAGKIVLCEFFPLDTMVHIFMHHAGPELKQLLYLELSARKEMSPDKLILIDNPPEQSLEWARSNRADPKIFTLQYYEEMREHYITLSKSFTDCLILPSDEKMLLEALAAAF